MKKFFSFTFAFLLMISMVALVGCNGLWDFDDDDDMTLAPTKFAVSGSVTIPATYISNLRAVSYKDLKVQAYNLKKKEDGTLEEVSIGDPTGVTASRTYEHTFSSYTGSGYYFFLKVYATNFEMRTVLGGLSSKDTSPAADVNATSTAKAFVINKNLLSGDEFADVEPNIFEPEKTDANWATILNVIEASLDAPNLFAPDTNLNDLDPLTTIPATVVTITDPGAVKVDDKVTLQAVLTPSYSTDSITWSITDGTAATISGNELTANATGTVEVTATADSGKQDTITITITEELIPIQSISITGSVTELEVGETANLTAVLNPTDTTNNVVTWTSSNAAVTVTKTGDLTSTIEGKTVTATPVTITAKAGNKTATFNLTVKEATIEPRTISWDNPIKTDSSAFFVAIENFGAADLQNLKSKVTVDGTDYEIAYDEKGSDEEYYLFMVQVPTKNDGTPGDPVSFEIDSLTFTGAEIPEAAKISLVVDGSPVEVFE